MDNQVAINFLDQVRKILLADKSWLESTEQPINEVFDMAICALREQDLPPTCNNLALDTISRQAAKYKLTALVNEFEEILSHIRERNEDDSVCGLCEYDGAYIGQSGDWCNECPGFDKNDCFVLKEKYRKEWEGIDE